MFQYMLLLRGATSYWQDRLVSFEFQYMLLLRGATPAANDFQLFPVVSIHAPLARSNEHSRKMSDKALCFNTCSSCEEQQRKNNGIDVLNSFNTCSSCEEQLSPSQRSGIKHVSIHAPLARSNRGSAPRYSS